MKNILKNRKYKLAVKMHWIKFKYRLGNLLVVKPIVRIWSGLPRAARKAIWAVSVIVLVGVFWMIRPDGATAQPLVLTKDDYLSGTSNFGSIQLGGGGTNIQLQRGVVGQWDKATDTGLQLPIGLTYGIANLVYGPNDNLYTMLSLAGQCRFARYSIDLQSWQMLNTPPVACGTGTILIFDGVESFYYIPGGSASLPSNRFFKYDIRSDSWRELGNMPPGVSNMSDGVMVERGSKKYIYIFSGLGTTILWRYSIEDGSWQSMGSFPGAYSATYGLVLTWDGDKGLYVLSNYYGEFKKFDITTQAWTDLGRYTDNGVYNRYDLEYDGNGRIYATKLEWSSGKEHAGFRSYHIASATWEDMPSQPSGGNVYDNPMPLTYDGSRYFYTYVANYTHPILHRFDTVTQSWGNAGLLNSEESNADVHYQMMYDGDRYAYYFGGRGVYDKVFRYDTLNRQSELIGGQLQAEVGYTGAYYDSSLYVMPLSGERHFKRYDIVTGSFQKLADLPLTGYAYGMSMVYGGDGYMYAVFGNGQAGFYRYNIALNSWHPLASAPIGVSSGGSLARIDRKIYLLAGNQSSGLYIYDMDSGIWSLATKPPHGGADYGSFVTSDQSRYLYLMINNRTNATARKLYRYDTSDDTWQRLADAPASLMPYASGLFDSTNDKLHLSQGAWSSLVWEWTPSLAKYVTSGVWYSKTYDLGQVEAWSSLQSDIAGDGTVKFETRTSPDKNIWTNWQQTSGGNITSPTNRYLQIKVTLAGDGSTTPVVSNIAINHTQETSPPSLPSQMTARSKKGGIELTTGSTHEHQHPYFTWSGSSDGPNGSGVDGYYVYFGLDSNANPETLGSYQSSTDYTVTTPMTAGEVYYLRIKAKDRLGNVSPAATYFSYRYFYVSPPGAIVKTSSSDFSEGINTGVAINNGSMKLQNNQNGTWSTGSLTMLPDNVSGAAQAVVGGYIYIARGGGTTDFWRYNLTTNSWDTLSSVPSAVNTGSSLVKAEDGELYLMAGNSANKFYKYDIVNDSWSTNSDLPVNAQNGASLVYVGDGRFFILFTGVRVFYEYDADTDDFSYRQMYPTTVESGGTGLWYDGDDTVYAYFGYLSWWNFSGSSRDSMAKYSISNDSWRTLAAPPIFASYVHNNLSSDGRGGLYVFTHNQWDNLDKRQRTLRYDIAKDSWEEVSPIEAQVYNGTIASDNTRYIYILPSGSSTNSRKMVRYDTWNDVYIPTTRSIDVMERVPYDSASNAWQWLSGNATTAAYDGLKYIYAIGGSEGTSSWSRFVKFDHVTGETKYLPPPPMTGIGGALSFLDNQLYYLPGKSTREFYLFDETKEQWNRVSDVPSNVYRPGSSNLIAVGDSLYAMLGNGRLLYKYTPDGSGGAWVKLADSPGNVTNGSFVFSESEKAIYVIAGGGSTAFYRYDVGSNSWSTKKALPASSSYGSAMAINNGKIFALRGNITRDSYVYDIASNTWTTTGPAAEVFRYGSKLLKISDTYAMAFSGEASPEIWKFVFPSETTAYNGQAVHISQPLVAAGIFDYAGVALQADIPDGTNIEIWTRSSDDGDNWTDWSIADSYKKYPAGLSARLNSEPKVYTQVKLVLLSDDNVLTPSVDSYSLQYYYDVDPPTNPSTVDVYVDSSKEDELSNNTWYNHSKPLIDWPDPGEAGGATDGPLGSRIAGYWVYLGTDPTASPRTEGVFVSDSEYRPTLSVPGIYYLRIQTQDLTGNIDGDVFAPFIYKFDNQPPVNPSLITATPAGFTSYNDYTFEWPNGYDAHSGIAGYCYHTGATSGPFSAEICQSGKTLQNISAAYRTGTNVFYVRAYDIAGNFSPYYTSASYYYSTDPPSTVTNLRAIPPTSTQNMFAFTWDLPVLFSGNPQRLTYCYSINILPSPVNTVCSRDQFISAFKAATQQGTNTIYVVAKDEADNVNWNEYATANFIANTVSPGIPLNLAVTDTSDRVSDRWSLTLTWDMPVFQGNGIAAYVIERSDDGHTFVEVGNTSTRAFVDLDIEPERTYYYRVRASDNVNNRGGASAVVARSAQGSFAVPPKIIVQPTAKVGFDQAQIDWATAREATSFVYYGTSPTDLGQSKGALNLVTSHSQVLTGLQPSTTYYYRVQSFDNSRNYQLSEAYSAINSFRTVEAARIYDVSISDITTSSALVTWRSSTPTKAVVEYGNSLGYGLTMESESVAYESTHSVRLTGLASGVEHHMRIGSTTEFGSKLSSDDYTFKTIAHPTISNIRFQPVDDETTAAVKVTWQTNVPTSSTVYYSALNDKLQSSLSELVDSHEIVLHGLASNTDYAITVEGRDQYGNLVSSPVQNWRSLIDTRPPSISDLNLSVAVVDTSKGKRAQLIATWSTDEPATSQVAYGKLDDKSLNSKTPLDTEPTTNHVVVISDLNLADIYKIQVVSRDLDGNTAHSSTVTTVTPDKEVNIFDSILDLMLRLFRF